VVVSTWSRRTAGERGTTWRYSGACMRGSESTRSRSLRWAGSALFDDPAAADILLKGE
jgi:hypothetical protein